MSGEDWRDGLRVAIAENLFLPAAKAVVTVIVRTPGLAGGGDVVVTAEKDLSLALDAARRRMEIDG